jgi:hypothetical protein
VLAPWPCTTNTIKGKVAASPTSKPWWVLWVHGCSWLVCAPKCSNYALTNLLFSLCKFVWIIDLLVNLPNPIPELQHAFYPRSVMNQEAHPNSFLLCCLHLWISNWVHQGAWGFFIGSQTTNLTLDHKKSRISLIYLRASGLPHTIGKLLMRATTLLQTSPQSKVCTRNYWLVKSWESNFRNFGTPNLKILGQNDIWV